MSAQIVSTDVLVIGGGLAGERCAIEAAAAGHEVLMLSVVPPRRSHSCAAQGGMQASLGNCVKAEGDNPTLHYLDTVKGSDWGADQEVAQIFAEEAPVAVRELAHFGVPWARVKAGKNPYFVKGELVEIEEKEENDGLIMHRDFGGTAKWRACYAGAGTGHAALYAVDSEAVRLGVTVRDRAEAVASDPRRWSLLGRCFTVSANWRTLGGIGQGNGHRHGWARAYLRPVHDQRDDQRRHGCCDCARYRRCAARQYGSCAVSSDCALAQRHSRDGRLPRRWRVLARQEPAPIYGRGRTRKAGTCQPGCRIPPHGTPHA